MTTEVATTDVAAGQRQELLSEAADQLAAGGVESAGRDAELLLAYVLDIEPARLMLVDTVEAVDVARFRELVERRAGREPLQHLTGVAYFRYLEVPVGPGVFIPRPETEVMTGWAIDRLREMIAAGIEQPLVVELCAGSASIAKSIATEVLGTRVHAVEVSTEAIDWTERNLAGTDVELHVEDMAEALHDLDGQVDLVIVNPPYVPLEAFESVALEAREHDPTIALFSGMDGLDAIRTVARVAGRLLRDQGLLTVEHAEVQHESAPAVFVESGLFTQVRDHRDLSERHRFVTAQRARRGLAGLGE